MTNIRISRVQLLAGAALFAMTAQSALAQTAQDAPSTQPAPVNPTTTGADQTENTGADIVVTGSILRSNNTDQPSPVTTLSQENLDRRGISTTQDAIQLLSSNNGPALTNSFSANGAFAGGASAVSLRGLSTSSTLVLFDGMRAAYYPLADDGTRNFVDLNTIPDDIVERIDVLRDGASSTYGADAVAGVVNVITKREFKGVGGRAEGGISERGDGSQYRLSLTAGMGDLDDNGYNAYMSGFYYRQELLKNNQRGYPYNTDDLRQVCSDEGGCDPNNVVNGVQADGYNLGFGAATPFAVRPRNAATGGAVAGRSRYQYLNGCQGLPSYTLSDAEYGLAANAAAPRTVCQEDITNLYGVISPKIERFGGSAKVTGKIGDSHEVYAEFNFLQTDVSYSGIPATIRGNSPSAFYFPRYSTSANIARYGNNNILQLPVYVCGTGVNCATAADRRLNPNNPFAAEGYTAAIVGRIPNLFEETRSSTRAYRAALGARGDITDKVNYTFNATAMHIDLQRVNNGYVRISNLLQAINTGEYNFINPSANSQQLIDRLAPESRSTATSDLFQAEGSLGTALFDLPGGPLQLGVGASIRYEAIDAPSINSDVNGPTNVYYRLNPFAAKGHRTVYSAYAELKAPIFDQLEIDASGRYDKYSTGPDNFSPKVGAIFTPIRQLKLRGTYSRGFRIPSFGEANATFPTTGYVPAGQNIYPNAYLAQYGANCSQANFNAGCPAYITGASYGLTSLPNENLKPEKSRSFTGGVVLEPVRGVSLTVDYYNIKKTGAILGADASAAIAAYYATGATTTGLVSIIPDAPDINNPNSQPRIAFVQTPFINAASVKSEGIDFGANLDYEFSDSVRFSSFLEASYILELSTTFPDGSKQRYDGTIGNFALTAGSGTPKWRGTWLNSLSVGPYTLSGTVNYFDGYELSAEDETGPGTRYTCSKGPTGVGCNVKSYTTVDLNASVKVNDRFTFYVNVLNLLDDMPPLDDVTYGAHLYNPVQGGVGILGRYYKAGVKVGF